MAKHSSGWCNPSHFPFQHVTSPALPPVSISVDSKIYRYDGVSERFNGNVNSVWVQHSLLIIPTKTFHHFKVSAVITMLWGVPDPHNQRLLCFSVTHTHTHKLYWLPHSTHTRTHTNMLRQIAFAITLLSGLNDIMEKRKWDVWVILLHPGEHPLSFLLHLLLPSFLPLFLLLLLLQKKKWSHKTVLTLFACLRI